MSRSDAREAIRPQSGMRCYAALEISVMALRIRGRARVVLLSLAMASATAGAQQAGRAQIYATVVDEARKPVVGLGSEDLVLRDGGVRQVSLGAERASDPLAVAIVAEGFAPADLGDLTRAADQVAAAVQSGSPASQVGVMTSLPSSSAVTMLSRDAPGERAAFDRLVSAGRLPFVDAVIDACLALRAAPTDRLIVLALIKRRADDGQIGEPYRLTDALMRLKTAVWTIEVAPPAAPGSPVRRNGLDDLLSSGTQLGGALRETVAAPSAMADAGRRLAVLWLSQYVVTYTWPDPMLSLVSLTTRHDRGQVLTPAWSR